MKSRLVLLLLAAHAGAALAQYKCTAANGAITFQQTPCFGAQAEEKLVVVPNGHPPPASGASATKVVGTPAPAPAASAAPSVDKRMLANYERQHQHDALEQALEKAVDEKDQRAAQRSEAVAAAQKQFGDDPDKAAALSDALAAIDSRYLALGAIDDSRIRAARKALADWDRAKPAR